MPPSVKPPYRADHVGSLLRPAALREAFRRRAGGQIDDAGFARIQDGCIRDAVALQQECGLEVVTDGEFRRGSYWGRFVERTEGFEIRKAIFKFKDDHGHEVEFTAPYAARRIARSRPLALDEFEFLRDATRVTPKITIPSPSTMHFYRCADFADRAVYPDAERFFADLAAVFRQEIAALVAAGCRYLQIDEVAIALLCDPAIRERVAGALGGWAQTIAAVIDEAQREGAVPRDLEPQALAAFVIDAWEGAVLRAKVERSRAPLDNFLSVIFAKVLA
jgi:5-methyltetrahydropteroyltriglutamate--homocysteine methyltransferase